VFSVGEIVLFYNRDAEKPKFHLCVSVDGHYLFLNTSRRFYDDAFIFDCSRVPLPASETGKSSVSCSGVMRFTDHDLTKYKAKSCGKVDRNFLLDLLAFAENCPALSPADLDLILDGISNAIGMS